MSEKMFRFFVFWRFCFECSSEMGKEINYLVMAILLIGMVLLLGGGYGLYSIRQAEKAYESTVGIVKRVDYKRVRRHRKVLTKCEILLRYDTHRYGELSVLKKPAFQEVTRQDLKVRAQSKGDEIRILYHPERPREVRFPVCEKWLWSILLVGGGVCVGGGLALRSKNV